MHEDSSSFRLSIFIKIENSAQFIFRLGLETIVVYLFENCCRFESWASNFPVSQAGAAQRGHFYQRGNSAVENDLSKLMNAVCRLVMLKIICDIGTVPMELSCLCSCATF